MDYSYLLKKRRWHGEALEQYGFRKDGDVYRYRCQIPDTPLELRLELTSERFTAEVFDPDLGERYEPFESPAYTGAFVSSVRAAAEDEIGRIEAACSESLDLKEQLLAYVRDAYGTEPAAPWEKYPTFLTLMHPGGKWYGLIMRIPYEKLGLTQKGDVDVINIKLPPEKIAAITDGKRYFPAYHMNKKYWLTVLLEGGADWLDVKTLVDESYALTQGKRGASCVKGEMAERSVREWLFPSNLKYYDLNRAFRMTDSITWHHRVDLRPGDIIYMYVTAPTSAILYRCEVTEIGLPHDKKGRKRFRMKKLDQYDKTLLTVDLMRECGSGSVRSERSVPEALSRKIRDLTGRG